MVKRIIFVNFLKTYNNKQVINNIVHLLCLLQVQKLKIAVKTGTKRKDKKINKKMVLKNIRSKVEVVLIKNQIN